MRIVGNKKERPLTFGASDELFAEVVRFNDEMRRLPTANVGFIKKGFIVFAPIGRPTAIRARRWLI